MRTKAGYKASGILKEFGGVEKSSHDPQFYKCKTELRAAFPGAGIELIASRLSISVPGEATVLLADAWNPYGRLNARTAHGL